MPRQEHLARLTYLSKPRNLSRKGKHIFKMEGVFFPTGVCSTVGYTNCESKGRGIAASKIRVQKVKYVSKVVTSMYLCHALGKGLVVGGEYGVDGTEDKEEAHQVGACHAQGRACADQIKSNQTILRISWQERV